MSCRTSCPFQMTRFFPSPQIHDRGLDTHSFQTTTEYRGMEETKLFPYNTKKGCIVGASKCTVFFPAIIKKPPAPESLRRNVSDTLKRSAVLAASMSNDSYFITVETDRSKRANFRIREYTITRGHGNIHSIGDSNEVHKLEGEPSEGAQVGVFHRDGASLFLVCHLNGKIEAMKRGNQT